MTCKHNLGKNDNCEDLKMKQELKLTKLLKGEGA